MANLLDGLKETLVELLRPGTQQESGELSALRQLYDVASAAVGMLPNRWYRLHTDSGNCVGFSFVCTCGHEFQLLSAFEHARDYVCQGCKVKFNLYKSLGIVDAEGSFQVKLSAIEPILAKLAVRPRLAGRPSSPRVVDTWNDSAGDVLWEGSKPHTGVGYR